MIRYAVAPLLALIALAFAPAVIEAQRADAPDHFEIVSAIQVSPITEGGSDAQILALYRIDYNEIADRPAHPISDYVYLEAGGQYAQPIAVRNLGWGHGIISLPLTSTATSVALKSKPGAFAAALEDEYALPLAVTEAAVWTLTQVLALEAAPDWPEALREADGQLTPEAYLYLKTAVANLDTVAPGLRRLVVVPPRRTPSTGYSDDLEGGADFRDAFEGLGESFGFSGGFVMAAIAVVCAVGLAIVVQVVTGTIEAAWVVAPLVLIAAALLGYLPITYLALAAAAVAIVIVFLLILKRDPG